jgi:hypothetical protein
MAYDQLKNATLPRALSEVVADLADLFQKELRLAKTEISQKISTKLQASIWFVVAGVLGVLGGLVLIEALVFGIASFGIALHWSCLIVAAILLVAGAVAFFKARADAAEEMTPTRTVYQVQQDIATAKEQLT